MKSDNLPWYYDLLDRGQNQRAHQMAKGGFGTYCFHLSGKKYLLQMLLQLPILAQCSASEPELVEVPALTQWITDLQEHKQTPEYKAAVERSQKRDDRGGGR